MSYSGQMYKYFFHKKGGVMIKSINKCFISLKKQGYKLKNNIKHMF